VAQSGRDLGDRSLRLRRPVHRARLRRRARWWPGADGRAACPQCRRWRVSNARREDRAHASGAVVAVRDRREHRPRRGDRTRARRARARAGRGCRRRRGDLAGQRRGSGFHGGSVSRTRSEGPHGVLLIDKPAGPSSAEIVDWARWALGGQPVGHFGTLDPAATGLLVLGVGWATRLTAFLTEQDKGYHAVFALGSATETDDAEGTVIEQIGRAH